jgi:glycosyltransferase involved in cell wall biosynthesis
MRKKLAMIGQFPPPIHGLSKALQSMINSKNFNAKYNVQKINITNKEELPAAFYNIFKLKNQLTYFTIAHSKIGNLRDLMIIFLLLIKKNNIILHYHGGYYKKLYKSMNGFQKFLNRLLIGRVNKIIVLGESHRFLFDDVISQEKIFICENFAEDSIFMTENEYEEISSKRKHSAKIKLLYLSNLIKTKGYKEVIDAFKKLEKIMPNKFELHIAGGFFEKDSEKILNEIVNDKKFDQIFFYHGVVDGHSKKKLLQDAEVFLLPTYYPNEGQPISVIEAMASGLLCVTTGIGGIKDVLHEENSFYVKEKSIDSIVDKLLDVQKEKITKVGFLNRSKAKEKFTEEMYIQRLIKILEFKDER